LADIRIGQGFDIHQLVEGRRLILGGVEIAHTHGLLGHSDADALAHAITDAVLGAAGLPDIGHLFPNTDAAWAGADSIVLLGLAWQRVADLGWHLVNVDATVLAERPKIAPHIPAMKQRLAGALNTTADRIGLKATTMETLGAIGRREGIAAIAVALLQRS